MGNRSYVTIDLKSFYAGFSRTIISNNTDHCCPTVNCILKGFDLGIKTDDVLIGIIDRAIYKYNR